MVTVIQKWIETDGYKMNRWIFCTAVRGFGGCPWGKHTGAAEGYEVDQRP